DCGPFEPGRDLREQLKPLASQRGFQAGEAGDVPPPRPSNRRAKAPATGAAPGGKTIRVGPVPPLAGTGPQGPVVTKIVGCQPDQLLGERPHPMDVPAAPPKADPHVAAIGPPQVRKRLSERGVAKLPLRIVFVERHEHADLPHALARLRPRRERPRDRRANQAANKFATPHMDPRRINQWAKTAL